MAGVKGYKPQKIYLERAAKNYPLAQQILSRLPGVPIEEIEDVRSLVVGARRAVPLLLTRAVPLRHSPDPIGEGKRSLLLARDQGRSFKPFPESEDYLSCDYFTLHVAEGCDLECSYCILQSYLTNPLLTVYVNVEEMLEKLQSFLDQNPDRLFRIGTGQLADSLSLDHLTGFSEVLIPFFAKQENAVLELKTKSVNIDRLLGLDPAGKTIVSWSMNSRKIAREEEHKCASIEERIEAAKRLIDNPSPRVIPAEAGIQTDGSPISADGRIRLMCGGKDFGDDARLRGNDKAQGYRVGFHFDPIIDYPGWEKDYEEVINDIFASIPEQKIAWVSLGCLRMMPALKGIMQERFPHSELAQAEWIRSMDGKLRYFKPRRIEIYRTVVEMVRRYACRGTSRRAPTIYLSMESPEVWRRVFGKDYSRESICRMLDAAASA